MTKEETAGKTTFEDPPVHRFVTKEYSGIRSVYIDQQSSVNSFVVQQQVVAGDKMRVVETYEKDAIQVEDEFFNDDESLSASSLNV